MDVSEIEAAHAARVAALDPLLPVPPPLAPGAGHLLTVDGGAGIAWRQESPLTDLWGPQRKHMLEVRLSEPSSLGGLLDSWFDLIHSSVTPGDLDCAAIVEIPSRDTAGVLALVHRGFVPSSVLAVRPPGRGPAVGPTDVTIRAAEPTDLEAALELAVAVVEYDAPFGKVTPRPEAIAALRLQMAGALAGPPRTWLATRDDEVLGLLQIQLPPESSWCDRYSTAPRAGYLSTLSVRADHRSTGVGSALVAHAHQVFDAAEAPTVLLHHALPNPRSTPFWYRNGYRPLWTTWTRRPLLR
ncbi:GNAT family N-acetyltransferase [Actinokineospora globicatena]|uniref:GNAT family N-acetyltransferase n=1 Tax=Actinokineospora globicatena TaxID=103729 RepID=UPI0020A37338|nr:GNAT family N-acetyltransferase [Actinokineospora globicatena]MCP2301785.1 Ribosomal protein S18 acetylase RimI [Actinokineospora globicatena]GLW83391.1 N-acetyltransferase [Actinokineospora globicatena]